MREGGVELHVPAPGGELAESLGGVLRVGADFLVGNGAPGVGRELGEVVEDLGIGVEPLAGGDGGQRFAGEGAPVFQEEHGPLLLALPVGHAGIGDEALRTPCVEDGADVGARLAVEVDEAGAGEGGGEEGDAEGVLGGLLEHADAAAGGGDGAPVAVAELAEEGVLELADGVGDGVGGGEAIGVVAAQDGVEGGEALYHGVALASDGPDVGRAGEQLEEHGAAGARGADDEDGGD